MTTTKLQAAEKQRVESPIFTLKEAAQYLNVSERRMRDMWDKREIWAVKYGVSVMFRKAALEAYIDAQDTALKTNY